MKKPKMGRPKKKAGDVRLPFMTRYSAKELKVYARAAKASKTKLREWMRVALDRAAKVSASR